MSLREEFLNYLSSKGIQFSPCVFKDEKAIPPREDWDGFVETLNNFFNKNKEVQDKLDEELKDSDDKLYTFNKCYEDMTLPDVLLLHKNYTIICAYLAGKALGVEIVEVEG